MVLSATFVFGFMIAANDYQLISWNNNIDKNKQTNNGFMIAANDHQLISWNNNIDTNKQTMDS